MGIAAKHLTQPDLERIARTLFDVKEHDQNKCELIGLCPIHGEKDGTASYSFGYNYRDDRYHCFSCSAGGDLCRLWCIQQGLDEKKDGFKAFCREFGIETAEPVKTAGSGPKELPADTPLEEVYALFPPLPPHWQKRLFETMGWTAEAIDSCGLRMQTYYAAKDGGAIRKLNKAERIAIPIWSSKGKLENIRLYKPNADRLKIISFRKGSGKARMFPPGPVKGLRVLLCEGEKDTLCAFSHGFEARTQTSKLKTWPADHLEPFRGKDVVICYDADVPGQKYAGYAAVALAPVAASVRLLVWPDFMGRLNDGQWPKDRGEDLTDFFIKHRKTVPDFDALLAVAKAWEAPKEADTGAYECAATRYFEMGLTGRVAFKPRLLADEVMSEMRLMCDPDSGLTYRWTGKYWAEMPVDYIEQRCLLKLGTEAQKSRALDSAYQVQKLSTIPGDRKINDRDGWICVQNCMLNVDTLERKPHDPDFFATFCLNVEYAPERTGVCSTWLSGLGKTIVNPGPIKQIQEFFGYCFTKDTRYRKALLLLGPGRDGKSKVLNTLRYILGQENCSAVGFNDLEDQFLRALIYNKMLNLSGEMGSKAMESQYFKAITGGDPIVASFKHKQGFSFITWVKCAFASNRLPKVLDNSDGYYDRILPIQFKHQFREGDPDIDPDIETKYFAEASGIFEWSLVGLRRLREQKGFTQCDETMEIMSNYRRLNSPVVAFVEDCLSVGPELTASRDKLYEEYSTYCGKFGYSRMHRENFFRELYASIDGYSLFRPRVEGRREYHLKGVGIKDVFEG